MIPIRLALRNFMCYRDNVPPLDFTGMHTVCISGDNGNGKTALMDAMTWALWGQARARSDDDLVYSGESEMSVEFDFAVGGQPYRIIRKHARPRRAGRPGQTLLDFQVATDGGFRPISGDTISQTQQKISQVLHLDYPTFINSAYLRQGRADEFTIKRPVERKQVLSDILGLSLYEELEARAKERAEEREREKTRLESALQELAGELGRSQLYQAELKTAQDELSRLGELLRVQESWLGGLRQEKEALENRRAQLAQLQEHLSASRKGRERWEEQFRQAQSRVKEYEGLIAGRASIEEGYARLSQARSLCQLLEQKFRRYAALDQQRHRLEMRIEQMARELLQAHAVAQSKVLELEASVARLPQLRLEHQQTQKELERLAVQEEEVRQRRGKTEEVQSQVSRLEQKRSQWEKELGEIEERLKLLRETPTGARCPLCETELGLEGRKLLEDKYQAEREKNSRALENTKAGLARSKEELKAVREEVSRREAWLNQEKTRVQRKAAVLAEAISRAEGESAQLNQQRVEIAGLEERMARQDFATREKEARESLEGELKSLAYDAGHHERMRQEQAELEKYEEPKRRLEEAERMVGAEREAVIRAEEAATELRQRLAADGERERVLLKEIASLPDVTSRLAQAEEEHRHLVSQQNQAREVLGKARANLERLARLEQEKKEKEAKLKEAVGQEGLYRELAEAFGKRGIPALLIEMALPEIEVEANNLLGRMTDNRLHLKLETQRETRQGTLRETLDINISDELGTRNYEMFSGGEAFRINFALRIALSKLLAKRAGAPLPTLIVDEGFGTQDSGGLQKLREAINSIQDDFEKIIVITHIEELKEAFPARINVVKTPQGSTLEVSEL
ncbi:MAG: SMC family ATPase [Chloroflexota bacterium]